MTTPSLLDGVAEFMTAAGQLPSPGFEDPAVRELRVALLDEEFNEYRAAEDDDNLIEIVDALLDIIVVAWGTMLAYDGTYAPSISLLEYPSIPEFDDYSVRLSQRALIEHHAEEYFESEISNNEWRIMVRLYRLIHATWNTLRAYIGTDATLAAADEVTISNLAKIIDGKVIKHPETGKVLKPGGWTPPDIEAVLLEHNLISIGL